MANRQSSKPVLPLVFLQRVLMISFLFASIFMMVRMDRLLNAALSLDNQGLLESSVVSDGASLGNSGNAPLERKRHSDVDTDDVVAIGGSTLSSLLAAGTTQMHSPDVDGGTDFQQDSQAQTTQYAYMFLIGGIDPATPGYRGFLYNVMIATYLLRRNGSRSDIVLYLQMSADTDMDTLPAKEEHELQDLGIKFTYMDKPRHDTFSHIIMEKFQILKLTQYERVMFMDADVIPVINMDYYMDLSVKGIFQPNFVVATRAEPANAGLFMVAPKEGDYEALLKIIQDQHESAKDLGYPFFDKIKGWGHSFMNDGDKWEGTAKSGVKWGFWCAHADQGLLYYWTKYHQMAVTIFRGNVVENWVNGTNGKPFLNTTMNPVNIAQEYSPLKRSSVLHNCHKKQHPDNYMCKMPYQDYMHYTGKSKPWQSGYNRRKMLSDRNSGYYGLWFSTLFEVSEEFGWNITGDNVNSLVQGESPLGYMSWYGDRAKSDHNWTADS
jgi:hypothetical protein